MTLGERSKEFYEDFFTVKNQTELAQGFALQYLLNIAGGAGSRSHHSGSAAGDKRRAQSDRVY